jgi:hypothetical protein
MATYHVTPELAEAMAKNLRQGGYPGVTAQDIHEQLAKQPGQRDIIGMWAAGMCEDNGILSDDDR